MTVQHTLRAALLAFALASTPLAAPLAAQSDTASTVWLRQQFNAYDARSGAQPYGAPSPLADSLATWDWLRRTPAVGAEPSLAVQAKFLTAHPDWPGTTAIRRRAEQQATDQKKSSDSEARAFFQQLPPQTAGGQARMALITSGPEAEKLAKQAWVRPGIPPELADPLYARFGSSFTPADHARRADALIWAGQTSAAARIVPMLGADQQQLANARIALRSNSPGAEALAAQVPAALSRNAGLIYDRAIFLERAGRLSEAEALLAAGSNDPGVTAPETWLEKRLALGRAAMRRGDNQTAYRLLSNHRTYAEGTNIAAQPLSVRVDLSDTEWLAGWIALRRLNRPADAVRNFTNFNAAVTTPISQTRGDYWMGRAEKARNNPAAANAAFERAAKHFDYYYGQLATEELGRTPELPMVPRINVSLADRNKAETSSLARAMLMLNDMGEPVRASLFVRALADSASTPAEARAVAELGQRINRPDLGVWVWKDARPGGDLSTFDLAYPRLPANSPLPPKDWVISHAIARQESSFDRTALSSAGARGLMQLMPATASDVAAKLGLPYDVNRLFTDPAYNLTLGSYYIGLRRDNFSNGAMAIAAYNAGAGNVRKWIALNGDPRGATTNDMIDWVEMIPIQETRNYVQRVSENAVVYSLLEPKRFGARPRVSEWLKGN
ncbi:lytic transglycosylase domain-containing protein [Sandaracinobacteroides hominis]|uniref:lytic transglycosylase domain-containing protein n=1 Tax=Sandaracinobacteroides hominis TaxID=2780086 RepID=UPI0018F64FFB|nr:lytic transglycosylase domain-containing protein [Sandaracinobacteroides hominis]